MVIEFTRQARMMQRAADLSGELYEAEFEYWQKVDAKRRRR